MSSDQIEQVIGPIPTLVQKQTGSPIVVLLVRDEAGAVSYTHLTLPTICSV